MKPKYFSIEAGSGKREAGRGDVDARGKKLAPKFTCNPELRWHNQLQSSLYDHCASRFPLPAFPLPASRFPPSRFPLPSRRPRNRAPIPDGQPVRPHPIPLLNEQSLLLEHQADLTRVVATDLLQHRDQNTESVVADHRAAGDLCDVPRFGGGDGEALSTIDVQHHVNVRASIADVHDA